MLISGLKIIIKLSYDNFKRIINLSKYASNNPTCILSGKSNISHTTFGKYVRIFDNVRLHNCDIGDYSYIQIYSRIYNAKIGNFCSIAPNVSISPGNHYTEKVSTHPSPYFDGILELPKKFAGNPNSQSETKICNIGNDVWIGEKVTVLDGINIATGAIVGAGSVVTHDVLPYEIVAGVPARHIRFRFPEETISFLLKSEWWNKNEEWFVKNGKYFNSLDQFKKCFVNI